MYQKTKWAQLSDQTFAKVLFFPHLDVPILKGRMTNALQGVEYYKYG